MLDLTLRVIPHAVMNEMFNRYAIGVRAHADGVGVKQANLSSEAVRGIARADALQSDEFKVSWNAPLANASGYMRLLRATNFGRVQI